MGKHSTKQHTPKTTSVWPLEIHRLQLKATRGGALFHWLALKSEVYKYNTGGGLVHHIRVRVRVGPPNTTKPRNRAAFLCLLFSAKKYSVARPRPHLNLPRIVERGPRRNVPHHQRHGTNHHVVADDYPVRHDAAIGAHADVIANAQRIRLQP